VNLQRLLQQVKCITSVGILNREVTGIAHDHRGVQPGYAFVCYEGVKVDGHAFIPQAIQNGASVLLGEKPPPTDLPTSITYLQVPNGRTALSLIAANWYGNPANRLKLIGITGTNGKTSTTYLAHSIFKVAGLKSAIITGKETRMIKRRAKDLRIDFLAQKALNKLPPYEAFLRRHKLAHQAVCAIGDDLLDLPILRRCGLAISVPNAVDEVKAACHFQTAHHGGRGAVREVIDLILKATGAWETVVKPFYL